MTSSAASPVPPYRVRVLVADGHAPTRAGVRASLDPAQFQVVGEASHARGAVELARVETPHICLLDIDMPGNGIAAACEISKASPDSAVVMLSGSVKDDDVFDSVRAGARGYLLKDMDPDRIGPALLGVLAGEAAFPRSLVARVLEEFQGSRRRKVFTPGQRPTQLTEREWEIMKLLDAGVSTDDIARRLFIAPGTVRVHISTVLKKLLVQDRQSALRALAG
ncbi:MAG: response regulator transcription factor [Sporichthyaceae bacterium]